MRQKITLLSIIGYLLIANTPAVFAGHITGADFGWECLGNNKYKIKLSIYRNCNGIKLADPSIKVSTSYETKSLTLKLATYQDITPVCPGQCSRCPSNSSCSFAYGFEQHEAVVVVDFTTDLKNGACKVNLGFSECCRINNFSSNVYFLSGQFNLCLSQCDNSPTFTYAPPTVICVGRNFVYNQGATDPDVDPNTGKKLDSLVYVLTSQMESATKKVVWSGGYDYFKPLYFNGFPKSVGVLPYGFTLDTLSGDLMFRPMKVESSMLAIKIEEYRNGALIGYKIRDLDIVVIKCPSNEPPIISGVDCSKPVYNPIIINACPGEKICFTICVSDNDAADSVRLDWNYGIPDGNFNVLNPGGKRDTAMFCWTPQESDISTKAHSFVVVANDGACPLMNETSRTFNIIVNPLPKFTYSAQPDSFGKVRFYASVTNNIPISKFIWNLNGHQVTHSTGKSYADSLLHKFNISGKVPYSIQLVSDQGCRSEFKDSVNVSRFLRIISTENQWVCPGTTVNLSAVISNSIGKAYQWWSTGDSLKSTSSITVGNRDTFVIAYVTDSLQQNSDTTFITINQPPGFAVNDTILCFRNDTITFKPKMLFASGEKDTIVSFQWYKNSLTNPISQKKSLKVADTGIYYLKVSDSMGCFSMDTATYQSFGLPIADFSFSGNCSNDTTRFHSVKSVGIIYSWNFGDGSVSNKNNPNHYYNKSGSYFIGLKVVSDMGCVDSSTKEVVIHSPTTASIEYVGQCINESILFYIKANEKIKSQNWNFGNGQSSADSIAKTAFNAIGFYTIELNLTDIYNCNTTVDSTIEIMPKPNITFQPEHGCVAVPLTFDNQSTVNKGTIDSFQWSFGDGIQSTHTNPTHTYDSIGQYGLQLKAITNFGCVSYYSTILSIDNKPIAHIDISDACLGERAILADGFRKNMNRKWTYIWETGDGALYMDTIPDYLYDKAGKYEVKLVIVAAPGCVSRDSQIVQVFNSPNAVFSFKMVSKGTYQFTAADGMKEYNWNFGDGNLDANQNPTHHFDTAGRYPIQLVAIDSNNCSDSSISILDYSSIGITELLSDNAIHVRPNPFVDRIFLDVKYQNLVRIEVYDVSGNLVAIPAPEREVNLSILMPGLYILCVRTESKIFRQNIVKIR